MKVPKNIEDLENWLRYCRTCEGADGYIAMKDGRDNEATCKKCVESRMVSDDILKERFAFSGDFIFGKRNGWEDLRQVFTDVLRENPNMEMRWAIVEFLRTIDRQIATQRTIGHSDLGKEHNEPVVLSDD